MPAVGRQRGSLGASQVYGENTREFVYADPQFECRFTIASFPKSKPSDVEQALRHFLNLESFIFEIDGGSHPLERR